ncbi:hypothetical protein [Nocardiopsis flavescens]
MDETTPWLGDGPLFTLHLADLKDPAFQGSLLSAVSEDGSAPSGESPIALRSRAWPEVWRPSIHVPVFLGWGWGLHPGTGSLAHTYRV